MEIKKMLTGSDIRAERNRHNPPITQEELSAEMGWNWRGLPGFFENGIVELSQAEYQRILEAIERIAERRKQESAA
ncbi:MAG: hypothetical protein JXA57_08365 [Armatimonadetes bacterium]|nr:hypothetical protein [Armatimonadota bacterium]